MIGERLFTLGLSSTAIAIAYYIETYGDELGYCYDTIPEMAARLGWSDSTINRALAELRKAGILERASVQGRMGRRIGTTVVKLGRSSAI